MGMTRAVQIYRDLLVTARKFRDANFSAYFTRIARDDWRRNPHTPDFLAEQRRNLEVLKRQTTIEHFYFRDQFDVRR